MMLLNSALPRQRTILASDSSPRRPIRRMFETLAALVFMSVLTGVAHAQTPGELIVDNAIRYVKDTTRTYTGVWCASSAPSNYGTRALQSCGGGLDTYRWSFTVAATGAYDLYVWWTSEASRSSSVPFLVADNDGSHTKYFNEQSGGGQWVLHGTYSFSAGVQKYVEVSDANGQTAADAIRLVPSGSAPPPPPPTGGPTLTVTVANAASASIRVYPSDSAGLGDGVATLVRRYGAGTRVWLSAPLRNGNNYFEKWQKDGADYDAASTTSLSMDANHTLSALYATASCNGVTVSPGIDSVRNAVAASPAGSTFCIKAGTHRFTASVVARTNDKFIGEPGATLNGSKVLTTFSREGAYWVATGQTQQEPPFPAAIGSYLMCAAATPACIYPEKVFRDGQDLEQVTRLADLRSGTFLFDYGADKIYLFDDPSGHSIEATTGSGGIIGYTNGGQGSVTVKNLLFEKFGGGDVSASAHTALKAVEGWRVENNEFRYISYVALANFADGLVRNNYIHHSGKYGLIGGGTIEGNVISFNNVDGFDPNNDAGGTKFHGTRGLIVRGNIAANNNGRGFWTDFDNWNTSFENNIVENNKEMGIFHEVSCLATIKNNVARGNNSAMAGKSLWNGGQIYLRSSKDVQIFGNDVTAVGPATHGISVRGGDVPLNGPNCGSIDLRNIGVHDNVVRIDSTDFHGVVGGGAGHGIANNIRFSSNTYYLQNLAGTYFWYDAATNSMTKEQWQAAGQDVNGRFSQY
jgi:hypothetical protein